MMRFNKNYKNNCGYGIIEIVIFIVACLAIVAYSWPTIKALETGSKDIKKQKIIASIEIAKDQFDQNSKISEKKDFDVANEEEKFTKISAYIPNSSDPVSFVAGAEIKKIKVNKLGIPAEIE